MYKGSKEKEIKEFEQKNNLLLRNFPTKRIIGSIPLYSQTKKIQQEKMANFFAGLS